MIYESAKKSECKKFTVSDFSGGLNCSDIPSVIDDRSLCDVCNMDLRDGVLKTREGIFTSGGCEIAAGENVLGYEIIPTGNSLVYDSYAYKLLIVKIGYEASTQLKLLLVRSDKVCKCVNLYTYSQSEKSGCYVNCLVVNDNKIKGCGIYAIVGVSDNTGAVIAKYVFELNSSLDGFVSIGHTDIYAPLVYVNGKGNRYYTLEKTDRNYPSGSKLENFSMISTGFRSTFKTDGVSNSFKLPVGNLSSSQSSGNVRIVFTSAEGNSYVFVIPWDSTASATVNVGGVNVLANINRASGRVSFTSGGANYALPYVDDAYNNLTITAYRAKCSDLLFGMTKSDTFASRVFVYGGKKSSDRNVICWSDGKNTLYFPEENHTQVGDAFQSITATAKQNNLLIILKSHSVFYVSGVNSSSYNIESILNGNTRTFSAKQSLSVNQLNSGIGCFYPQSVQMCANRIVFMGADKCVYALTSTAMSQKQVYLISKPIASALKNADYSGGVFAVQRGSCYLLCIGGEIFTFNFNTRMFKNIASNLGENAAQKSVGWYRYSSENLLGKLFGGLCFDESTLLLSAYKNVAEIGNKTILLLHTFGGDCDKVNLNIAKSDGGVYKVNSENQIECSFTTKLFDFGEMCKKSVAKMEFELGEIVNEDYSNIEITYLTERGNAVTSPVSAVTKREVSGVITKYPRVSRVNRFGVSVKCFGNLQIGAMAFWYKLLK